MRRPIRPGPCPRAWCSARWRLLVLVVLALTWLSNRSMQADQPVAEASDVAPRRQQRRRLRPPAPRRPRRRPVVITATEPVWLEVKDGGTVLKQGVLAAGQSFEVPANAAAPVLTTGKPEALRISVGTAEAPPVGPAGKTVSGVSLKAADLMRPPAAAPTTATTPAARRGASRPLARSAPADTAGSASRGRLCRARSTGRDQQRGPSNSPIIHRRDSHVGPVSSSHVQPI